MSENYANLSKWKLYFSKCYGNDHDDRIFHIEKKDVFEELIKRMNKIIGVLIA